MGVTELVQPQIGFDHFRCDPRPRRLAAARRRAALHDGAKTGVATHAVVSAAQPLAQTARDLELGREKHHARIGRPPKNRLPVAVPGEDPAAVGLKEPLGAEIAADGQ
jgi:hypothetical protein